MASIPGSDAYRTAIPIKGTDQLLPRIPSIEVTGDRLQATATSALATAPFLYSGGTADAWPTNYAAALRSFPLRRVAAHVDVAGDISQNAPLGNDVLERQIDAKLVAMWSTVSTKLATGTNVDSDPAGLVTFAAEHPDGVTANFGQLQLSFLTAMLGHVRPWNPQMPLAFVMNRFLYQRWIMQCFASGFQPECRPDPVLGQPVLHHAGVPVLVSDFIPNDDFGPPNRTSAYLVSLGPRADEPQFGGLVWFFGRAAGPGINVTGPHRDDTTPDLLIVRLDLDIAFATLSSGAVLRMTCDAP